MDQPTSPPSSPSTDQVIARVRAFMAAQGWSSGQYARAAGLRDSTLRFMASPDWNPTVETLRKLEAPIPEGWQPGDPVAPAAHGAAA